VAFHQTIMFHYILVNVSSPQLDNVVQPGAELHVNLCHRH